MQFTHFLGVDVSKETLDITVRTSGGILLTETIINQQRDIKAFLKNTLSRIKPEHPKNLLVCLEQTGIYSIPFLESARDMGCTIWVEDAVQIKQVLKVSRSKNDKLDAKQIAEYAYRFFDRVTPWEPERLQIKILRKLITQRRRLIELKKSLATPVRESSRFECKEIVMLQERLNRPLLNQIEKSIKEVDDKIKSTIESDEHLKHLFQLITSVEGIGPVVASHMLVYTNEFKRFANAKKLACHAGVVPFDRTSGTSIRGKSAVSHRANKTLKCVIHLAAVSITTRTGELREYYLRKVAEGKNKMSVINAIRNKLILRIYACVRDNRPYEKKIPLAIA